MTEKRCNYTGTYFRFLLSKLRPCIVLSVIFSVCGFPMLAIGENESDITTKALLMALSVLGIAGIIVMSFITPLITMKHLYTKTSADNILSLPLTAWQRYICETGTALLSYAAPYLPAMLFAVFYCEGNSAIPVSSLQVLLFMLSFTMFCVLLICFCGRLAEAVMYPVAMNILIPLFTYFVVRIAYSNIYGVATYFNDDSITNYSNLTFVLMSVTSPVGCSGYHFFMGHIPPWTYIAPILQTAAYFAIAFLVYRKRPAHNIGQPFVFGKAYAVNSVCIAFFSTLIFISFVVMWTGALPSGAAYAVWAVVLLILMLIMELINYKKIKSLPKFAVKYTAVFAGAFVLSLGLYYSEGLGETKHIPPADETDYISLSVELLNTEYGEDSTYENVTDNLSVNIRGGSELAGYVRSVQKDIIDKRISSGNAVVYINHNLNNGRVIMRQYRGCELPDDFFETVVKSEDYRVSDLTYIDSEIKKYELLHGENSKDHYNTLPTYYYSTGAVAPDVVRVFVPVTGETLFDGTIDWQTIHDALYSDLINDADFGRHDEMPVCTVKLGQYYEWEGPDEHGDIVRRTEFSSFCPNNFEIYESYTNTLAYLKNFGDIPSAEGLIEKLLSERDYPLILTRTKLGGTGQTVRVPDESSVSYNAQELIFLSREEFMEAAAYSTDNIEDADVYIYALHLGWLNFLMDSNGVPEYYREQLRESGDIDREWFQYDEESGMLFLKNDYVRFMRAVLSGGYNATGERLFTDGRYVFTNR